MQTNGGYILLQLQSAAQKSLKKIDSVSRVHHLSKKTHSLIHSSRFSLLRIAILLLVIFALPAATAFAATATLAWDPSSGPVAGYKVYYGKSSGNYPYSVIVGNNTSCTISGMRGLT